MNYCIVGNEPYLVQRKMNEIVTAAGIQENDLNVTFFDASNHDFSIQSILEDCNTLTFFGDKKIVVIKNPLFLSATKSLSDHDANLLMEYLKNSNPECDLIFMGSVTIDKRKKIVKQIKEQCLFFELNKLSDQEFTSYVNSSLDSKKINLTISAKKMLHERLFNDMGSFHMELEKLSLYDQTIDEVIVGNLVTRPLDEDVFHLVNAVVQKNLKEAMTLWRDLQVLNKDPIYLIALLSSQFKLLYQVKVFSDRGLSESSMVSELKVHPFRVKKALEAVRMLSKDRCLYLLNTLAILDQDFKMGMVDKTTGFELFLIKTAR